MKSGAWKGKPEKFAPPLACTKKKVQKYNNLAGNIKARSLGREQDEFALPRSTSEKSLSEKNTR